MKKLPIILAIIGITVSIIGLYAGIKLSEPNPNLIITNTHIDVYEHTIDFYLSNDRNGIAFVDKIELVIENFEIPGERIDCGPLLSRPYQYITEQITIQPNSNVIPINFIQDGWMGDTFQISEGLKYGNGEVDQFTIPFSVKHNSSEYLTSYSFDFFIQSYWCNLSQCTEKNVIQSEIVHAERLGACRLQ